MRYRLETPHYISEAYLFCPAGTEIGDGTEIPYKGIPSQFMIPLDDEAKAKVKEMESWREAKSSGVAEAVAEKAVLEAAAAAIPEIVNMGRTAGALKDKAGSVPGQLPKGGPSAG